MIRLDEQPGTAREKLDRMTIEDLRLEVGILHGFLVPEGYGWVSTNPAIPAELANASDRVLSREMKPGVWISLCHEDGHGRNGPGWSWYVSDKPGVSYWERGGGCLAAHAAANAEAEVASGVYPPLWEHR